MDPTERAVGKKLLSELLPRHQQAREVFLLRQKAYAGAKFDLLPLPPFLEGPEQQQQGRASSRAGECAAPRPAFRSAPPCPFPQVWRRVLDFERSNPQQLDERALAPRILLAYEQALLTLYRHPEVWLEYAQFLAAPSQGPAGVREACAVLERGIKACPHSSCLPLYRLELLEAAKDLDRAREGYEALVARLESQEGPLGLDSEQGSLAWMQYMQFLRR